MGRYLGTIFESQRVRVGSIGPYLAAIAAKIGFTVSTAQCTPLLSLKFGRDMGLWIKNGSTLVL